MAVSNAGFYSGYSEKIYDGYKLTSQYITMHDGCKLAIDIYRPTKDGILHQEPLPVVWTSTQYRRRKKKPDGTWTSLEDGVDECWFCPPKILEFLYHGYIVACLDVRGSGASFGTRVLQTQMADYYDLYETNEWLAAQPWCTGKTGMFGMSFLATEQWACALTAPPSLRCILPAFGPIEVPYLITNGINNLHYMGNIDESVWWMNVLDVAPPVDEDVDGALLAAAIEEHKTAPKSIPERAAMKYLDSYSPAYKTKQYIDTYFGNFLNNLDNSDLAVYIIGGWKDLFDLDSFEWYATLKNHPKKLTVGPWLHDNIRYCYDGKFTKYAIPQEGEFHDFDWTVEHLRWFDYWLKDIDNGIMDEPPIRLYTDEKPEDKAWKYYSSFPIPGSKEVTYYFHPNKSGSVHSVNDGSLLQKHPKVHEKLDYTVDYSVSKLGFWETYQTYDFTPKNPGKPDWTEYDEKCITFTTAPFAKDTQFTCIPVARLWISADAESLDYYVVIEDVDESGKAYQISEGKMRSSVRKCIKTPPYDTLGTPFHRNCERDQEPLPKDGTPVELAFSLFPFSRVLKEGHRLRISIANSDKDSWDTPEIVPAPKAALYYSPQYPSSLTLMAVDNDD